MDGVSSSILYSYTGMILLARLVSNTNIVRTWGIPIRNDLELLFLFSRSKIRSLVSGERLVGSLGS